MAHTLTPTQAKQIRAMLAEAKAEGIHMRDVAEALGVGYTNFTRHVKAGTVPEAVAEDARSYVQRLGAAIDGAAQRQAAIPS